MSTEFQDDIAAGNGRRPEQREVVAVRDYLKSHNRAHSVMATYVELKARDFNISKSTVGRDLKEADETEPNENPVRKAKTRAKENRRITAKSDVKPVDIKPADVKLPPDVAIPQLIELLKNDNSSTQLAIDENRARMALNIVICHWLAAKPELMLLDMRGAAALIDALTVGAKLSGGASIDVTISTGNSSANGHEMKDVTPQVSAVVAEIDKWRHARQSGA